MLFLQPHDDPSKNLCEACETLDLASLARQELPRSHPISFALGLLSEIVSRQATCELCRLVVRAFSATWKQDPPPTTVDGVSITCKLRNRAVCVVRKRDGPGYSENFAANEYEYANCRITLTADRAPSGYPETAELQVVDKEVDIPGIFNNEKLLDRRPRNALASINFDLVKKWVSCCRHSHGDSCQPDTIVSDSHEQYRRYFRLIDVQRNCIVDAKSDEVYLALSYVWGQTQPMLKLLLSNKIALYQDGSLAQPSSRIPQTILDAMEVTRRLGETYLWVDALCIMQDDYDEKAKVIGEMDLIYSRGALGLVAVSASDANAGLPGLYPGTRDLDAFEEHTVFGMGGAGLDFMVARSRPSTIVDGSKWNSRGWTYQERLFSRRMLLFTDEQLFYWCGKSSWCEDTVLETEDEDVVHEDIPIYRFRLRTDPSAPFMKQLETSSDVSVFADYTKSVLEFSRRDLSFESDVVDAFAGLLRSLTTSYHPNPLPLTFYFGLPSAWFEAALCWTPVLQAKVRRRNIATNQQNTIFPSWTWTGWVGQVEYKTLHARPEVEWYRFNEQGTIIPLPAGEHPPPHPFLQSSIGPRPLREKWKPPNAPTDVRQISILTRQPSQPHLLLFYSSRAFLPVIEQDDGLQVAGNHSNPTRQYFIAGESKGWISLDAAWVASHPGPRHEFVVVNRIPGTDWDAPGMRDSLHVWLVERRDEVCYRVGVGMVAEQVWADAGSEWMFFRLG